MPNLVKLLKTLKIDCNVHVDVPASHFLSPESPPYVPIHQVPFMNIFADVYLPIIGSPLSITAPPTALTVRFLQSDPGIGTF